MTRLEIRRICPKKQDGSSSDVPEVRKKRTTSIEIVPVGIENSTRDDTQPEADPPDCVAGWCALGAESSPERTLFHQHYFP
jgi:hypothetical protein